ncbi:MAG: bacillithiol biosynthesis cysteine-adding enzyme BshC [marine benthic group bacterium]|jgi:bacillithiol biosynthesis cysteine-adding enzyme BshC|nr:bacillithiol biosynthesis cysteine-adding enzyme BshC [Gemmatimonadota bacterium]MCL7982191.1 bacillithiol biosynthesis cysteine-adding enzyme BshC [Gemmatimonadota bacterium]
MSDDATSVLDFRRLRPGPPGTVAGDLHDGAGLAARLLHPARPDGTVSADRPGTIGTAPFSATTEGARRKLDLILHGGGVLVSTGQQPGLFLGPLYSLYKILTAASCAQRIEAATGRPALASFWIAGDDHDWEEVGAASLVDRGGVVQRVVLEPGSSEAGRAVGAARLGDRIVPVLDRFLEAAGDSEFAPGVEDFLTSAYSPSATMTGAFRDGFTALLGDVDVALFDPTHPEARRAAVPFLSSLLANSDAVSAALQSGTVRVQEAGYAVQLSPPAEGAQVFFDDGNSRAHLIREAGGFRHGRAGEWRSIDDWLDILDSDPARFSPAAASRPMLESNLLPVARTVLGPGEMAYWAQLGPLFEQLSVPFPETVSRDSWLIVEPKVDRWLAGMDADPVEFEQGTEAIERRLTEESRPEPVDRGLRKLDNSLSRMLGELADTTRSEIPGLDSAFGKAGKAFRGALSELEGTIDRRVRDTRRTSIDRVRRAAALLYPEGQRQERVDSPISFLVRYGQAFVREASAASGLEPVPPNSSG